MTNWHYDLGFDEDWRDPKNSSPYLAIWHDEDDSEYDFEDEDDEYDFDDEDDEE